MDFTTALPGRKCGAVQRCLLLSNIDCCRLVLFGCMSKDAAQKKNRWRVSPRGLPSPTKRSLSSRRRIKLCREGEESLLDSSLGLGISNLRLSSVLRGWVMSERCAVGPVTPSGISCTPQRQFAKLQSGQYQVFQRKWVLSDRSTIMGSISIHDTNLAEIMKNHMR